MQHVICQDTRGAVVTNDSQTVVAGKTYALIIGISKYETFPSLQYADKDAAAFNDFLRSKAGGKVDSADIYYKTNEKARAGDLWRGVSWLEKRADSTGETAIIYFSGHGDAANAVEAYLLAYDAPNQGDPNLYNMGGTFQIYNIKMKVKQMVSKGVKVILITDACRNNDLPGREDGNKWIFQSITEVKCGEIQMISCSGNEQSLEDTKWGKGRGVFSFHLINGLKGSADTDPQDGRVTLFELERYVRDQVRIDTRSATNNQARQNPVFCCSEKNDVIMSTVETHTTNSGGKSFVAKKPKPIKIDAETMNYMLKAFKNFDAVEDTHQIKIRRPLRDSLFDYYYKLFSQAITKKELIAPKGKSATDYLDLLLPLVKDSLAKGDLKDELVASLMNEAQTGITRYARPPILDTVDALNSAFFNTRGLLLNQALKYTTQDTTLTKDITARKLVLEARAMAEEGVNISVALSKVDSSLSLMNSSYANHTKGLLLLEMEKKDEAIGYFDKAAGVQKKWACPLSSKGDVYRSQGNYDSAIFYYKSALTLNPANDINVFKLGVVFQDKGQYDSSITYLQKAIHTRESSGEQNYNSANSINYLAKAYDKMGDNATAESLYKKAISICKKMPVKEHAYYANTLTNLAGLYDKMGNSTAAKPLYEQASVIKKNTKPRVSYEMQAPRSRTSQQQVMLVQKAPDITPENIASLLIGVSTGNNIVADFSPYLCGDLKIMVKFNSETMTFASLCDELKAKKRAINNPAVKFTKNRTTNCITDMEIISGKGIDASTRVSRQPGVLASANVVPRGIRVQVEKPQIRKYTAPTINADDIANLLGGVSTGKNNATDFAPYLCNNLDLIVKFNDESISFASMCKELKQKARGFNYPKVKLTKDPETNCITSMEITAEKVVIPAKPLILQPSGSATRNDVQKSTQVQPPKNQAPTRTQQQLKKSVRTGPGS